MLAVSQSTNTYRKDHYSRCPKTERSLWETEHFSVWISDIRAIRFIFFTKLDRFMYIFSLYIKQSRLAKTSKNQTFGFGSVDQPNIWNLNQIVRISDSVWYPNDLTTERFDNRTIWQPNDFEKRQNPNVRISDTYCINMLLKCGK